VSLILESGQRWNIWVTSPRPWVTPPFPQVFSSVPSVFQDFWFCFSEWKRIVRDQPVRYLTDKFVLDEGESIRWASRIWAQWNTAGFKAQIRAAAWDRLVRYFTRHVPGGFWNRDEIRRCRPESVLVPTQHPQPWRRDVTCYVSKAGERKHSRRRAAKPRMKCLDNVPSVTGLSVCPRFPVPGFPFALEKIPALDFR